MSGLTLALWAVTTMTATYSNRKGRVHEKVCRYMCPCVRTSQVHVPEMWNLVILGYNKNGVHPLRWTFVTDIIPMGFLERRLEDMQHLTTMSGYGFQVFWCYSHCNYSLPVGLRILLFIV